MSEGPRASYECRGDKKNTRLAFFIFFGVGALAILLLALRAVSSVVWQAIALISLVVAAYIFIRYIATAYRYEIHSNEEEGGILYVIRVQGKKELIQRKIPLSSLVAIYEVKNNSAALERPKLPVINYSSHLMADEYTLLHFAGDESVLLRVNIDEDFRSVLVSYLPEAEMQETENTQAPIDQTIEEDEDD